VSDANSETTSGLVSAGQARRAAQLFPLGNIIAMLIPVPLGIFWLGASMVLYAMNRHHPNPRVGYYTQQSAYRLYGVAGFVVVVATFFGTDLRLWLATWVLAALIVVPWSIVDLVRIKKETWLDTPYEGEHAA
jgi:hypothetical protein